MNMQQKQEVRTLLIVSSERHERVAKANGFDDVKVVDIEQGAEQILNSKTNKLRIGWEFENYMIGLPAEAAELRDDMAVRLGDERCKWFDWPANDDINNAVIQASRMWTDEVCTLDDIPDPGEEITYASGFDGLDQHGFRFVVPAFMTMVGPYGSGKSVLLRQLLCNLNKAHGWKCLVTAFEEKVKPRYQRDLRRHFIGHHQEDWSAREVAMADAHIRKNFVFLRRKRLAMMDMDRLLDRIEFAVRVFGVKVVAIDPVNEIDHRPSRDESKTDYIGRFIIQLKALADDYGLLVICCIHPPKVGAEKRLSSNQLLTLNDGADSANWGNKSDIGWCVWRDFTGPTWLHIDKLKDHESMGSPTLARLTLDRKMNRFDVTGMGYDMLGGNGG